MFRKKNSLKILVLATVLVITIFIVSSRRTPGKSSERPEGIYYDKAAVAVVQRLWNAHPTEARKWAMSIGTKWDTGIRTKTADQRILA